MFKIKSATRLAITIGMICASITWLALSLKLVPDPSSEQLKNRVTVTKAIAVTVSSYAESRRYLELSRLLERNIAVDPNILSIGIRRNTGSYLMAIGPHHEVWQRTGHGDVFENQVQVNILSAGRAWGQLEISFRPVKKSFASLFAFPFGLVLFMACALTLLTWAVLAKTFTYLNPSKVVPTRVRSALDSLASGLVLMTNEGEIAHANKAFSGIVLTETDKLLGQRLDGFDWCLGDGCIDMPWKKCQLHKAPVSGDIIEANIAEGPTQKYMVNATPIYGSNETQRGVLVSFEDVTALESKKSELAKIIQTVRMSRDEVERQNEQLNFLASYDPLTQCMNRRAFFGHFERLWAEDERNLLTVIMLDIDHFKSINDNHGHSAGDSVLTGIGELLTKLVEGYGVVCRYGGEEFAVLFDRMEFDECCDLAEKIRNGIEAEPIGGLMITASLGISGRQFSAMDPQHMLDQADQSLYAAKQAGRNQLVRFDRFPAFTEEEVDEIPAEEPQAAEIEYSAVTGLLSALSFRSAVTAEHSVRVADLSVAIGQTLLNHRDLYRLEIAALLHDVGKIGVPDAILNKPGKLMPEEWAIMRRHDEIGVAIVRSAFASEEVARTIERHHDSTAVPNSNDPNQTIEETTSSKILNVCDAFDSMVSDQIYRQGMSTNDALDEIRRNTPVQFDPIIVDRLFEFVKSGNYRTQMVHAKAVSINPECAIAAGQHVDELFQAISDKDMSRLEKIVGHIKEDASEQSLGDVADRLELEVQSKDKDFDKLLDLADEVMQLCRVTRSTFTDLSNSDSAATSTPAK